MGQPAHLAPEHRVLTTMQLLWLLTGRGQKTGRWGLRSVAQQVE